MEDRKVKSLNRDSRSKNRFRFSGSKQRSKKLSADVYRSYKRRYGVTSAGEREESVHKPKRQKKHEDDESSTDSTTFAQELELASERNGSQLFAEFYREIWPLTRSVPELLHHSAAVADILLAYMLSPASAPNEKSVPTQERCQYIVNHATTDILHLLAVMAKDLQSEIHPFVYDKILPRIVMDILNPPPVTDKQPVPVDVLIIETSFRTLSYIFQHDAEQLLAEPKNDDPVLEPMRKFYGPTLGHKRQVVRRLAAETFAPLIRRIPSDGAKRRHLKRVTRALTKASDSDARSDALDGVSTFLFETAKGTSGRLHSKGAGILRFVCDSVIGIDETNAESMSALATLFFEKIYHHHVGSDGPDKKFDDVCVELNRMVKKVMKRKPTKDEAALVCSVGILLQTVDFRDGIFFDVAVDDRHTQRRLNMLIDLSGELTDMACSGVLSSVASTAVVELFFASWNTAAGVSEYTVGFHSRLTRLLLACGVKKHEEEDSFRLALVVRTYLDCCNEPEAVRVAFPSIVGAVASLATVDADEALTLLFRLVSRIPTGAKVPDGDEDSMFSTNPEKIEFQCDQQDCMKLLNVCTEIYVEPNAIDHIEDRARLGYSVRCVPFLCSVLDGQDDFAGEKKAAKWMLENTKVLVNIIETTAVSFDLIVPAALSMEGFARLMSFISADNQKQPSWVKKMVVRCAPLAWTLLQRCPSSLWVMKSVATLCSKVLVNYDISLCDDSNAAFDLMVSNLRNKSHFLRLHTLQILTTFPSRPYVVDHADLDLTGDLDEEPSGQPKGTTRQSGLTGNCDILETLVKMEGTSVGVETERSIISLITRIEVLAKSGRLPIAYAEAVANHMIGIFHIKFSNLWAPAARALASLTKVHHNILCDTTCAILEELLKPELLPESITVSSDDVVDSTTHHRLCVEWDSSGGRLATLFQARIDAAEELGQVSSFLFTDRETVLQELLKVLEKVPEITAKSSRRIVPMFVDFLKFQYYCYHDNEPDARELNMVTSVEGDRGWKKDMLNRRTLESRLLSFLRAFAAVKGSDQLYQKAQLLNIFSVYLSHQDGAVAHAALVCLINFQLPHVIPYSPQLKHLLKKGGLRDALLDFPFSKDSDVVHPDHRKHLLPVVQRILFGRLSASSVRGMASKDSPLARRKAIVSSLAQLEGNELFPLIYLMIRNYTPDRFKLMWEKVVEDDYKTKVLFHTSASREIHFGSIPVQRHEGFMNLLSALISQLGHSLADYVPTFMSILLGIMKGTAVAGNVEEKGTEGADEEVEQEDTHTGKSQRMRGVRTLSFRCTASILDKFAGVIDFTPCSRALWDGIYMSVADLPSMVSKGNNTPSILELLVVLSSHAAFLPILKDNPVIVESVVKCIGPAIDDKALDAVLDFVLNLLPDDHPSDPSPKSRDLIGSRVLLVLRQLRSRFSGILEDTNSTQAIKSIKNISKELMVLRKIGDMLLEDSDMMNTGGEGASTQPELFNTLTTLLVRFVSHPRCQEVDLVNALGIVSTLLPKVDAESALFQFFCLSKLLSHDNWSKISSTARREVTTTMLAISDCNGMDPAVGRISRVLQDMFAMHPKRVDEMDYDRVLPALSGLADNDDERQWMFLVRSKETEDVEPKLLSPIVYACFALLHQEDVVVSRSAFNALRALVRLVPLAEESPWPKFIETTVVPGARSALRGSTEQIRRHAISLVAEISCKFKDSDAPNLHGDLHVLACEENSDLDFFVNILNVQSHRRCRALQRLRARLNETNESGELSDAISVHSLANIILPLVTTPIYESTTNLEEALAQESVATVGAVGRHLTWSKYHSVLWTALNQFSRHPNQEKLIIGMICSLLDSFHFDLNGTDDESSDCRESAVWRALEKRVIPKIEDLLVKEKRHRTKGLTRTLRPNVVLALLKLLKKFPSSYFEKQLPRLLAIVCDALKNKDSNVRELARKALAAMTVEMGTRQLSAVIQSLAVTLKEGYQLHVRNATLHHILLKLSSEYNPPTETPLDDMPHFDRCIPAIMDLIMQDMFGVASERKDDKRLVKEAMGSKSSDSLEIVCQLLLFRPKMVAACDGNNKSRSSVHAVVTPLFEKVRQESVDSKSISKIKDCLRRVVVGLSHNDSVYTDDVLQFVYATIAPILELTRARTNAETESQSSDSRVVIWHPKLLASAQNAKGAVANKKSDQAKLAAVKDGAQAPKLTGSGRHELTSHTDDNLNGPTSTCALEFGLNMLLTSMKNPKNRPGRTDLESRLTPFLSLLTTCVCESRDDSVSLLSIRGIGLLLKKGVRPDPEVVGPLGSKIIDMLTTGEAVVGVNPQLTQVCMAALTTLMKLELMPHEKSRSNQQGKQKDEMLSLTEDQIGVLVSLLKESVETSDETNASLGVIKALLNRKHMSPEVYDLMESMLDLSVRSHRESFREQCSNIFLQFLLDYPLSKNRFEQHLRQVMLNMKYEHKEGRLSAIRLVSSLVERLPLDLVDQESQLIFLPLILQLVNDETEDCRAAVSKCLTRFVARVSPNVASSLFDYNFRWYNGDNPTLRLASLQMFGIFAVGKTDMFAQNDVSEQVLKCLQSCLETTDSGWEEHYFSLVSLEKVLEHTPVELEDIPEVWAAVLGELSHAHLWVKMCASRVVGGELQRFDPTDISGKRKCLVAEKGVLYDLATYFSGHLDAEESNMSEELSELAIKSLTWLARAMDYNPTLCYATGGGEDKAPVKWLFTRLSNIARRKGTLRRQAIFKCFAALLQACGSELVSPYLHLMMEPLHRAVIEAAGTKDKLGYSKFSDESTLAKEALSMLEESCGDEFLNTLVTVKVQARERHDKRKEQLKAEMVADPAAAAKRKILKQHRERNRRKRRVEEHRSDRGGKAKRHY